MIYKINMLASNIFTLYHTVKYLRITQIVNRILRKFKRIDITTCVSMDLRTVKEPLARLEVMPQSYFGNMTFRFLNETIKVNNWNDPELTKLWTYNLHYFDDLNAIDASSRKKIHLELINNWISENPPLVGNGWEPYPLSLRIVNWIKFIINNNINDEKILSSLQLQVKVLSQKIEYHLLGNHLFANAKALVFAGAFYSGEKAEQYLNKGLGIIDREIREQILSDGGHFELSPMYHNIILTDLLDLCNLNRVYQCEQICQRIDDWNTVVQKMIHFAVAVAHPDGDVSFFNDSAFGIAPKISDLISYAERLGVLEQKSKFLCDNEISFDTAVDYTFLEYSGYVSASTCDSKIIIDVAKVGAEYIPGHAHADTLSFELSIFGERLIVNSGTSEYGLGETRLLQRKTKSHNTIEVSGLDSSEVWSGFRVARRAMPKNINVCSADNKLLVEGTHDGYARLHIKTTHSRRWVLKDNQLTIDDYVSGDYLRARSYFYFHPDIKISEESNSLILTLKNGRIVTMQVTSSFELVDSRWYPQFGLSQVNKCLIIALKEPQVSISIRW